MLIPEVPGRRGDYRSLSDYNFAILLDGLADVIFAYEVGNLFQYFRLGLGACCGLTA